MDLGDAAPSSLALQSLKSLCVLETLGSIKLHIPLEDHYKVISIQN